MCYGKLSLYGLNTSPELSQIASQGFGALIIEHLARLTLGSQICILDHKRRLRNIKNFTHDKGVDWVFFTPSFFSLTVLDRVNKLRTAVLGGMTITDECIDCWTGKGQLISRHGPSEIAIVATACIFIGEGLAYKKCVANLIDHNALVFIGCVGELPIRGRLSVACMC